MLASITSDYELFGTVSVTDSFSRNKVPEHHLSSTTICTEPEPSQNTSSTISTPSSPELLRACHSTLPSPRWSITLEPSPTEKPRRPTFDIAEGSSESRSGRRTQPSQGLQLRRVKTLRYSPRAAVAQIRRAHSEGCVSWETCGCTGCSRKDDGMALNARAQSSCCSLVISNPCSCVPPTSRSAISTTVVETVLTGAVVTDAFSGGTENEAVHTTTETNRIAFLTLRRKALIDELSRLHLELLDSLRAEWLLTRVFPEGFEDLQDYIIDPNPRLKSTSFPLVHLLQHSNLNGSNNRAQMECPEPSGGGEIEAAGTFEPSDFQGDLLMREISSSSALIGSSSFKGSLQSFASTTTSQLWIGSVAGTTEMMTQSIEYEPKLQSSRTSNWSECGLTALSQLEQRLARLEEDYAVVSQIYKVHRQRASETHWTAYRSAYKCNAQKLRELSKEMEQLRREIKMAVSTSQDPLQRSDSLSTSQTSAGFTADPNEAAAAVTLPRRRPFRPPPCIRRHTMAQPRAGANSWWTLKRRMGSRPTLPTAPPSMFTSICDGAMTLSAAGTPTADETTEFNKPDNYGSLGRKKRIQAQGRTRLSLISLAFRFPLRTLPKNRSLTAQPSDRSSVDTLANADSLRSPSESRVVPGPEDMKNDETPKPRLRGSKWRTYRKPTLRPFSSLELLPFTRAEQGEDCHLRRSRSYPDARGWNYPVFFQSSRTESSALVTSKTLDPLDDFKYASPVTDLLRTDFPDEANSASTEQVNPLKVRNQTSCHPPPQQFAKAVFVAASPSLRSSSGCYSFSSQASSQLSSLALSTSCGHSSAVMVRPETGASTPPRSPLVEVPSNDVVHLRRPARTLPARAVAAPSAAANAPIRDSEAANGASCQAFCPATNSIRCICSCISEVETADALRNCSCLDITVPDGPSPEDIHSCSTMTPVPQHRPPAFLNGCDDDERSIDIPDFLKSRQEKGRSCTLPGNRGGGSNRSSRKLENGISVRRSFNPLAIFRLGLARGQSTEDAVTVLEPTMVVKSATLTANSASKTPPVESPVPVTKPRQSFWQRARQSLLPSAATNSPMA